MQQSGEIDVTAYPDKLFFTPDGHYALLSNDQPISGSTSLILVDLTTKQVTATLPGNSPTANFKFDSIVIAGNSSAYVHDSNSQKIFQITIPAVGGSEAMFGNGTFQGVLGMIGSNEVSQPPFFVRDDE